MNRFNPYFRPDNTGCLYFGGGSKSTTSSASSTSNQVNDNRVAASEGSISAGQGANVSVQTLDADLAYASLSEVGDISREANQAVADTAGLSVRASADAAIAASRAASDAANSAAGAISQVSREGFATVEAVSNRALDANTNVARDSIASAERTARDVLDFRSDDTRMALEFAGESQKSTNDLIRFTNEQFTAKLANNAGDAPQNTVDNIVKYLTIAATALGIIVLIKNKGKA